MADHLRRLAKEFRDHRSYLVHHGERRSGQGGDFTVEEPPWHYDLMMDELGCVREEMDIWCVSGSVAVCCVMCLLCWGST